MVKTTFLIPIRNSRLATGEAGGTTQHGAYQIEEGGKERVPSLILLDTQPLHLYVPVVLLCKYYYLDCSCG